MSMSGPEYRNHLMEFFAGGEGGAMSQGQPEQPFIADYASSAPAGFMTGVDRPYTNAQNLLRMQQYGQPALTPEQMMMLEQETNKYGPQGYGAIAEQRMPKTPMTHPDSAQTMRFNRFLGIERPTPERWR